MDEEVAGRLRIELLGGVRLRLGEQELVGLPSRKAEALLIFLACHHRPFLREVLANLLWNDRPHQQALTNLRTILAALRAQLPAHLIVTRASIAFNHQSPYWLDVEAFIAALATAQTAARTHGVHSEVAVARLEAAVALYLGDFLAGYSLRDCAGFEEWVQLECERLHRLAGEALHQLVEDALAADKFGPGLAFCTRLLQLAPFDEQAHRCLMLLAARRGDYNMALAHYKTCAILLERELGVAPALETTALYERIQVARSTGDSVSLTA